MVWASLLLAARSGSAQLPFECIVQQPANATALPPTTAPPSARTTAACTDVQNIRVNVHFLQHDDGTGSFNAVDDGNRCNPNTAYNGYVYAQSLIFACNGAMDQNPPLRLAPGSTLAPIAKRIQWVLDGVYFDRSSFYRQGPKDHNNPPQVTSDYTSLCIKADSVINIFLTEEFVSPYGAPCTLNNQLVAGNRGFIYSNNQASCNTKPTPTKMWAVVDSPWTNYMITGAAPYLLASTVNHELCHLLGLNHPFEGYSTCADAPPHPSGIPNFQCWNLNDPVGTNCDVLSKVSNNLMDYNAEQSSLSPCQIGIMQDNLNSCLQDRYVYKCSNCLPTRATFDVPESTCGQLTNIWLDGRATFYAHWYKLEIDLASTSQVFYHGNTHYETTEYQQVGRQQLDAVFTFQPNSTYRIKLATYNNCGSAAVRVKYLSTYCYEVVAPGNAPAALKSSTSLPASHE